METLLTGLATFVAGSALWLFGLDVEIVVFTPTKVGMVLMVIGGLEVLNRLSKTVRGDSEVRR